jgi:hypothetical protein
MAGIRAYDAGAPTDSRQGGVMQIRVSAPSSDLTLSDIDGVESYLD